jgi:hypothetical protein
LNVDELDRAKVFGLFRAGVGAFILLAPRSAMRSWTGRDDVSRPTRIAARGLAGRDLAIGLGIVTAAQRGEGVPRWLEAGAMSDAVDALSTLSSFGEMGKPRWLFWTAVCAGSAYAGLQLASDLD